MLTKKSLPDPCVICQFFFFQSFTKGQYQSIKNCPSSSARFLCILLFLFVPKTTMIVAVPPQVLFTLKYPNERKYLDYILKFIVGEGEGFNRLGNLSTVSSDQEKLP